MSRYSQYEPRAASPSRTVYTSQVQSVPPTQKVVYVQQQPAPQQIVYVQPAPVAEAPPSPPQKERKVVKPKETYTPPRPRAVAAPEEKSKYSCPRNCLWVLPLLLAILGVILGSIIIDRHRGNIGLDQARNVLDHFRRHITLPPINQIRQVAENANCPSDFTPTQLGSWPGTDTGCLCEDGTSFPKFRCYTDKRSCRVVASNPSQLITNWRLKSKICQQNGQRMELTKGTAASCAAPFSTPLCFPPHLCCVGQPLSKRTPAATFFRNLKIKHENEKQAQKQIEEELIERTHLPAYAIPTADNKIGSDSAQTTLSSDPTLLPFVEIVVSFNREICWNREIRTSLGNNKFYPFERQPAQGCGEFSNIASETLDSIKLSDLLDTENRMTIFDDDNKLPYYDEYESPTNFAHLVAIRRTQICRDTTCDDVCKNIKEDDIEKIASTTSNLLSHLRQIAISVVVLGSVLILICVVYIILRKAKVQALDQKDSLVFKIIFFFGFVIAILCIVFGSYYLYVVNSEHGLKAHQALIEKYIAKQCFGDLNLEKAFKQYLEAIQNTEALFHIPIITLFWLSIAFVIFAIIALALRYAEKPTNFFEKPF